MMRLAIKNLLQERGRLVTSIGGVAASLLLLIMLDGIFAGVSEQIVAYPQKAGADVWVMQEGVSNMHMASSVLPGGLGANIASVEGVRSVTPVLYTNGFVEASGRRWFSYIVGIPPGVTYGGPWAMARGERAPESGTVVLPDVIARKSGIEVGDEVVVLGRGFRVSGLSAETFSLANSITFMRDADLERLLSSPGVVSYFLVKAQPGVAPGQLAARIASQAPGTNAMTREAFVASDRSMAQQMGVDIIQVMTLIGSVIGVLIISLTMYTATARRAREFGVAKAIGTSNFQLFLVVGVQALAVVAAGLGLAVGLSYALRPLVGSLMPEIALLYVADNLARVAVAAIAISVVSSILPAWRIARVDPATVFKE